MKIALLLFGQLRTFDMCKWMIKNILDHYDCDVFMSIDKNNLHQHEDLNSKQETRDSMVSDAIDFIKPKDFYVTDNSSFENDYNNINLSNVCVHSNKKPEQLTISDFSNSDCLKFKEHYTKDINRVYSTRNKNFYTKIFRQYFVLNECYKLLNNYIDKNNVEYDLIIKLRYDQFFWTNNNPLYDICQKNVKNEIVYSETNKQIIEKNIQKVNLNMDNAEENTIKVFGGGLFSNYGYVNDQFWTHGMDLINIMSKFYSNLERLVNKTHREFTPHSGCTPEHLFLVFLLENDVTIKRSNFSGIFVREFENRII
jgi:hypothetical protein